MSAVAVTPHFTCQVRSHHSTVSECISEYLPTVGILLLRDIRGRDIGLGLVRAVSSSAREARRDWAVGIDGMVKSPHCCSRLARQDRLDIIDMLLMIKTYESLSKGGFNRTDPFKLSLLQCKLTSYVESTSRA